MNDIRTPRGRRERTMHLSPDAERLVTGGLGLANSGSRTEDRFWQSLIEERLEKLLESAHPQAIDQALERLQQTDMEAYGALVEAVEEVAECVRIEHDGQLWEVLLVAAPMIAWTRFGISSGPLDAVIAGQLSMLWKTHLLADGARFSMLPFLYSIDQLPRDFAQLRKLTRRLGATALSAVNAKNDTKTPPDTAEMLADNRFLLGAVAVPLGKPMFRWQSLDKPRFANRVQCLEDWISHARPILEPILVGCGFECLLPDAFHINMRESDRRVRPYAIKAAAHFLTLTLQVEARQLKATIAAFGNDQVDEYRIGFSLPDNKEVLQGVVWPLLGAEVHAEAVEASDGAEGDLQFPIEQIKQILKDVGITDIEVWQDVGQPEYCDDCGAPLFPNDDQELAHTELPEDLEVERPQFH
jgi:Protein of unknown function (DUF2863)